MKISTRSIITLSLSLLLMPLTSATPSTLKRAAPIDINPRSLTGRKWPFSAKSSTCPTNGSLPPTYLTPSLIVPVSAKLPTVAFPPTDFPLITPNDFCSIFNLEIPATAVGQTCTLKFLFPDHDQTNAPYVYLTPPGGGHFTFTGYAYGSGAIDGTTYAMQPPPGPSPPTPPSILAPGNAYIINAGSCGIQPGQTESVTVSGLLCSNDTTFAFLQNDHKCPLGFFVALSEEN